MQIDLGAVIATLLYENNTVSIPGLGAFIKTSTNAEVDAVQGRARPERSLVTFDPDLPIDDGLLIAHIKDTYSLSYLEAKQTVSRYVEEVKSALRRKETVLIPDVGRLYNDYSEETRFMAAENNFNLDTFGLPEVSIQPLTPRTTESVAVDPEIMAEPREQWIGKNWPVLLLLFVLLSVLLGFLYFYPKYLQEKKQDPTANLPSDRLNVKPPNQDKETIDLLQTGPAQREQAEADYDDPPADEEISQPVDERATCVIAIGIFREKANVDKLVQELMQAGYEPYIEKLRSTTRVGVQFKYERSQDIDDTLQDIRRQFVREAFVLKK